MLVPIQIVGKEEIRISRCKHKKIFLENIESVIKMRVRIQKMLASTDEPLSLPRHKNQYQSLEKFQHWEQLSEIFFLTFGNLKLTIQKLIYLISQLSYLGPIDGSKEYLKYIWYYQRYQPKYQISKTRTIILHNITQQMQGLIKKRKKSNYFLVCFQVNICVLVMMEMQY